MTARKVMAIVRVPEAESYSEAAAWLREALEELGFTVIVVIAPDESLDGEKVQP